MARDYFTDEQVEQEIERLKDSPLVKLAKKEQNLRYKRRQVMWSLRSLEKRGKELAAAGVTMENVERMLEEIESAASENEGGK